MQKPPITPVPNGGLPMAAIAGKFAIQRISKHENINNL
jgi:hypothetical protein